jgi:LacI family transcriptional regulator
VQVALCLSPETSYEVEILRGILSYAQGGRNWSFYRMGSMPILQPQELSRCNPHGVIGFLPRSDYVVLLNSRGIPAVNLSNHCRDVDLPRVGPDDVAIGAMGADHFLRRGVANLAFAGIVGHWYSERRQEGFVRSAAAQPSRSCHVFSPSPSPAGNDQKQLLEWLLGLPKPVGVMAANDQRGRHVIEACHRCGLVVPQDVAVLGVDNDEWQAALAQLPMSSVEPNAWQIGQEAAAMLDRLLSGQAVGSEPVWVQPRGVISRRSSDTVASGDPIVSQAAEFVWQHSGRALCVEDVVDFVGVSRRNLEMRFRRYMGCSPYVFIREAHVERAKRLLLHTELSMKEIAARSGFRNPERLSVVFREVAGMPPTRYRQVASSVRVPYAAAGTGFADQDGIGI